MSSQSKAKKIIGPVIGLAVLVLLMLYMTGVFAGGKIPPGGVDAKVSEPAPEATATVSVEDIIEYYEAVGTVRPRTETRIEAQATGRILQYNVSPGAQVDKGQVLIQLDSDQLNAQVEEAAQGLVSARAMHEQAKQALEQAKAAFDEAAKAYQRVKTYFASEAATQQQLEQAESAYLQAQAGVRQAEDGVKAARAGVARAQKVVDQRMIAKGYTTITAPTDGEVVKRLAEKGDLAWPGKPLLVIQTRSQLRLEAVVREGLISRVRIGTPLEIAIDSMDLIIEGTVEEIVPSADSVTRTFLVKVDLPQTQGMFPGMFGRLMIPASTRSVVAVPKSAIERTGQLEMVTVREGGIWKKVFVKTGKPLGGGKVEVLSGLEGGETVGVRGGENG
ncbi:RND family efflux transporter, MFP subunit [Desulfatibacillum alkenivorans DSM 16219]|jgi:RND family efflux transporter MFP subunit|uniref:RND family efflux transporter, MFP subunit n=1 Tax=Desulfatibacillum alkenivorans DSM 16219 TaxID=1121393 RepID=A0A1M6EBY0_9BACT|nr:efflux RND transporter periplasmic adaptor subunit [Desulfatibacillum alkenivorans]SHI82985.1 RND family efflux transporter, MFP subunit [Desulfatibacillum alkenivorans DSM 16219]